MAISTVEESKFIETRPGKLRLRITVGYAQAGGSYVVLIRPDNIREEIKSDSNGNYEITIDTNCILNCITVVQDINNQTNNTAVIHDFQGELTDTFTYKRSVQHHNDRVVYDIEYIITCK